jgi:predicted AAA+ superfamily ATPase
MYVERGLKPTLHRALEGFPGVLVTGPRQSGKTTFLRHEAAGAFEYLTFDDPLEREFARTDPEGLLNRFEGRPAILDEIQYVPGLLSYLKMRIDRSPERMGEWLLTGSQQFGLMRDVTESLAGRIAVLELLPFSAREHPPATLGTAVWAGGYPIPALHPERRDLWLRSYLRTYVERDVRQVKNITDLKAFEHFLALCAARHGQAFHKAELAREVGISQPTVSAWAGVLEASYVIALLPPYHRNFGKRLVKAPKLYFLDSALACVLTRQPDAGAALAGSMGGPLLEGWVVSETVKAFTMAGRKPDVYHWRSQDGLEVDLIVQAGGKLHPLEVKLSATPTARHMDPLRRFCAMAGGEAEPGLVVCMVEHRRPLPGGHMALPWHELPQWLAEVVPAD